MTEDEREEFEYTYDGLSSLSMKIVNAGNKAGLELDYRGVIFNEDQGIGSNNSFILSKSITAAYGDLRLKITGSHFNVDTGLMTPAVGDIVSECLTTEAALDMISYWGECYKWQEEFQEKQQKLFISESLEEREARLKKEYSLFEICDKSTVIEMEAEKYQMPFEKNCAFSKEPVGATNEAGIFLWRRVFASENKVNFNFYGWEEHARTASRKYLTGTINSGPISLSDALSSIQYWAAKQKFSAKTFKNIPRFAKT